MSANQIRMKSSLYIRSSSNVTNYYESSINHFRRPTHMSESKNKVFANHIKTGILLTDILPIYLVTICLVCPF